MFYIFLGDFFFLGFGFIENDAVVFFFLKNQTRKSRFFFSEQKKGRNKTKKKKEKQKKEEIKNKNGNIFDIRNTEKGVGSRPIHQTTQIKSERQRCVVLLFFVFFFSWKPRKPTRFTALRRIFDLPIMKKVYLVLPGFPTMEWHRRGYNSNFLIKERVYLVLLGFLTRKWRLRRIT